MFRLNSHVPRKTRAGRPFRALEQLEDRVTPIVGQYAKLDAAGVVIPGEFLAAPLVQPGQGYDGVVKVETAAGMGTGSLFRIEGSQSWGHHILTAAHALNTKAAGTATFEMSRTGAPPAPGAPPPIIRVDVPVPVQAGSAYQVQHPSYAVAGGADDIGIIRLVDPVTPSPDRLLVAPYNAEQYGLYTY